jgi:hypothetical protein
MRHVAHFCVTFLAETTAKRHLCDTVLAQNGARIVTMAKNRDSTGA